jgi:hypothetical protein
MNTPLLFVSAQPDVPYFHWQIEIYVHNFIQKGISPDKIHVVFAMVNGIIEPSKESLELKKYGINIHHYIDDRVDKKYIPSIKPYLISKWIEENPDYGKCFFLHDSDIVFRELPNFDELCDDDIIYLSDTIGYIGYDYIMDCCRRYEDKHSEINKGQLLDEMASVVGVDVECIECNQNNSGGGQYIIKNTSYELWDKIYKDCTPLYNQMLDFQKRYPIHPGEIQFWTAEMWSLLWNLWLDGKETIVTDDLDFSWATDPISVYERRPILHMAGVTEDMKNKKFYKGEFINVNPIEKLIENPNYFDYIENNSSTIKYVEIIKSLIKKT